MKKRLKEDMQVSRLEDSAGPWHVDAQPAAIVLHMREAYFMKKASECWEPRFHDFVRVKISFKLILVSIIWGSLSSESCVTLRLE